SRSTRTTRTTRTTIDLPELLDLPDPELRYSNGMREPPYEIFY
ncbi:4577_t:CDS:1, partial [Ambispora gerdemannii]